MALQAGAAALRLGAGALARPDLLTVRVVGQDRVRFLNGMLTSDVAKLTPGRSQPSVKASAKGRVEGLLRVRMAESAVELDLLEVSAGRVAGELVKYVVMDDVQLSDASAEREVVSVWGPRAADVVGAAGWPTPAEDGCFERTEAGMVVRDDGYGVPGFEVHAPVGSGALERLVAAGAAVVEEADVEVLRVEAGVLRDGVDVGPDTLPLEAGLDAAVDLAKGCYIGQEVIARATHRGGVRHRLVGFRFEGGLPAAGAELWAEGGDRAVGEVTSAVHSPTVGQDVGLGYVRVEHREPGSRLRVGGEGGAVAVVAALPHVPPPA